MQFISEDPIYVLCRNEKPQVRDANTGDIIALKNRHVFAQFKRGTAPDYAKEIALATFEFRKRPGLVSPGAWVSYYDSAEDQLNHSWSDDERKAIEAKLSDHHACLKIEKPKVATPYRLYDQHRKVIGKRTVEHAIKDILAAYESAGFDVQTALAYEAENGNHPEIVKALEGLLVVPEEETEPEPLMAV